MNLRLIDRSEACPLCGSAEGCAVSCPSQEWPPKVDGRLLATRILVGIVFFLLIATAVTPSYGWQLGLSLSALACTLVYAVLRAAEEPTKGPR